MAVDLDTLQVRLDATQSILIQRVAQAAALGTFHWGDGSRWVIQEDGELVLIDTVVAQQTRFPLDSTQAREWLTMFPACRRLRLAAELRAFAAAQ